MNTYKFNRNSQEAKAKKQMAEYLQAKKDAETSFEEDAQQEITNRQAALDVPRQIAYSNTLLKSHL